MGVFGPPVLINEMTEREEWELMKDQATFLMEMIEKQNQENERAMLKSQELFERQLNFIRQARGLPPIEEKPDEHNGSS